MKAAFNLNLFLDIHQQRHLRRNLLHKLDLKEHFVNFITLFTRTVADVFMNVTKSTS